MRVELTHTQQMVREQVRNFARERVKPVAAEIDRDHRFPGEIIQEMGELGLMGIFVPEQYGGAGFDHVSYAVAVEEMAAACASIAVIMSAHASLAVWPVLSHGSEEQKNTYLPRMAGGKWLGCFALTEPGAGSEAAEQKITAVRDGDHYRVNGSKSFVTNAPQAAVCIVFAVTDPSPRHSGISAFMVETATGGFRVIRVEEKMGIHGAHSAALAFTDMAVPCGNLLGKEGEGFTLAMQALDGGRIGVAAQAVGIARAALEDSLAYAKGRRAFDHPIAQFQAIQWMLADMATEIEAARLLILRAADLKDRGLPHTGEASMAKLFASEVAMWVATKAVQIHGGYGFTKEFAVERYFRDAKITEIDQGTSEMQRLIIAESLLRER